MNWSLARKLSLALLAILVATMLATAVTAYYKFEDVMGGLVRSRYSFVVFTIKKKVEDSLALGLPLRQLRQVQESIELEKIRDDNIQGIQIYDSRGQVVFNTDRGGIGVEVPDGWVEVLDGAAAQPFSLKDDESLLVGLPLVNNLGKVEGAVVLRYPAAYLERDMGSLTLRLGIEVAAAIALFGVVGVVSCVTLLRVASRRLGALEDSLARVLDVDGPAPVPPAAEPGDDFTAGVAGFIGRARDAAGQVHAALADVERLDRLA